MRKLRGAPHQKSPGAPRHLAVARSSGSCRAAARCADANSSKKEKSPWAALGGPVPAPPPPREPRPGSPAGGRRGNGAAAPMFPPKVQVPGGDSAGSGGGARGGRPRGGRSSVGPLGAPATQPRVRGRLGFTGRSARVPLPLPFPLPFPLPAASCPAGGRGVEGGRLEGAGCPAAFAAGAGCPATGAAAGGAVTLAFAISFPRARARTWTFCVRASPLCFCACSAWK